MPKSDKWCLERLEFGGEFYLNEGETTIGRNREADIITSSGICSRNHCVIELDQNENIYITNKVSRKFCFECM